MAVVFDAKESTGVNVALIAAIKKDPEKAVEFLVFSGQYAGKKEAREFVDGIIAKIAISDAAELLSGYFTDLSSAIRDLVGRFDDPDAGIEKMSIKVTFDRLQVGKESTPNGFMVANVVAHNAEGTKLTGPVKSTSTGAGGTKRESVPTPDDIKSWRAYLTETHPDSVPSNGTAFSAPRILKSLKDEKYIAAAKAAGHPDGE